MIKHSFCWKKYDITFAHIASQRKWFTLWANNCFVVCTDEASTGFLFNEEEGGVKYLNWRRDSAARVTFERISKRPASQEQADSLMAKMRWHSEHNSEPWMLPPSVWQRSNEPATITSLQTKRKETPPGVHVNKIKMLLSNIWSAVVGADSAVGSDPPGGMQHPPLPLMPRDRRACAQLLLSPSWRRQRINRVCLFSKKQQPSFYAVWIHIRVY